MKEKKGISLIVLIVTIIVMIIIAGAVIISLTNDNLIDQAKNATTQYNIAQIKEQVSIENAMRESGIQGSHMLKVETGSLSELGIEDEEITENLYLQDGKIVYRPENVTTEEADEYISQGIEAATYIGVVNSDASLANYEDTTNIITANNLQSTLENNRFANIVILEDITVSDFSEIFYLNESNEEVGFAGIIDGMEHTITINGGEPMLYRNDGTIKNITIEGSSTDVFSGSLILECNYGTVLNCHNKADITGYMISGIADFNYGNVINCSNEGTLTAEYGVGGIVEYNEVQGVVRNCYNKGDIILTTAGTSSVGGVVGQNQGEVNNSYNVAEIRTEYAYFVYGIAGIGGKVVNSYNLGQMNAVNACGTANNSEKVNNLYSIKQNSENAEKGSATEWIEDLVIDGDTVTAADKTELLKRLNALNSNKIWVEDTNNINDGYPILYWQAD